MSRSNRSFRRGVRNASFRRNVLTLAVSQGLLASAQAATITVTTNSDAIAADSQCSLPEAIANANGNDQSGSTDCTAGSVGGDTIELPSAQTITLGSALPDISEALTISGNGATLQRDSGLVCDLDVSAAASEFRLLTSLAGGLQLSDLTLQHGCADGAGDQRYGGGVSIRNGDSTFDSVTVSLNRAEQGGGAIVFRGSGNTLSVVDCVLSGNSAGADAGAIYAGNGTTLSIQGGTVSNNSAGFKGGAIYHYDARTTISNSSLTGNTTGGSGGAIYTIYGDLSLTNVTLSGNTAGNKGGGLSLYMSTISIQGSTISSNSGFGGNGGGVYGNHASLLLQSSTVADNSAATAGGGLFLGANSTATIDHSTIDNNHSGERGGGLRHSGTLTLIASTLTSNTAIGSGGGLYSDGISVTVSDSTFAYNDGASYDQFRNVEATFTSTRSLFVGSGNDNCSSSIGVTSSYNLTTDPTSCAFADETTLAALLLQPLADNGGPTSTHGLGVGSSAIDAGGIDCSGTDQRGETRPSNGSCDIGAYEVQNTPPTVVNDTDTTDQDTAITVGNVLTNDADPVDDEDAGTLTVVAVDGVPGNVGAGINPVAGGEATIASTGEYSFDPANGFDGLDTGDSTDVVIAYTVSDGLAEVDGSLTITVSGLNDPPQAEGTVASTLEDAAVIGALPVFDPDAGEVLMLAEVAEPPEGSVVLDSDNREFTFDPGQDFQDLDDGESRQVSFRYTASDEEFTTSSASVFMTVNGSNDAPATVDDLHVAVEGQTLTVDAADGLLANDSDIDGDTLMVIAGSFTPAGIGGTLVLSADGSFEYTPPANTTGTASFDYTASDGDASSMATLTINVVDDTAVDLQVDKTDGVTVISPTDLLTYTITVLNDGPGDAIGATVEDILPMELTSSSWSCEGVGEAICPASGSGDIQVSVDIPAGDAVVFQLMATVTPGFDGDFITNTATATAPDGITEANPANNIASDTNANGLLFGDGFEGMPIAKAFSARSAVVSRAAIESRLPLTGQLPVLILRGQDRGDPRLRLVTVHARRTGSRIELRISRLDHGAWVIGAWQPVSDRSVEVRW